MRQIDADALSARMYHDAFETDSDMQKWDSGCWIRYKMFERALEDAPTIKPEQKWIPCSERLPGVNGSYLVTVHPNYIVPSGIHVDMLSWFNGKWWFDLDGQDAEFPDQIIAWTPLPEPYKRGEAE